MRRAVAALAALLLCSAAAHAEADKRALDAPAASSLSLHDEVVDLDAPDALPQRAAAYEGLFGRTLIGTVMGWNGSTLFNTDEGGCPVTLQAKFNCTEEACEDLVAGACGVLAVPSGRRAPLGLRTDRVAAAGVHSASCR